ncbi:Rv1535 domain-containing protein [Mycobacterium kyorinense]|uniref:Rv1535 domain-containing protein n=1 Tax=Mycobacterium kyorinense TaxID=487514 RepID=UPI0022B24D4B|nr:Rv1535 domain-containing protein [Mycobacterium kyorinense]
MSTTDALADPLASALAQLLTVPVIELYAVLWRVGVVEVGKPDRVAAPQDADQPIAGLQQPPRRLPPRLLPALAPTPGGQAVYSRAAG